MSDPNATYLIVTSLIKLLDFAASQTSRQGGDIEEYIEKQTELRRLLVDQANNPVPPVPSTDDDDGEGFGS